MIFKFCDTNVNILTYVPLSMQTSKMELTNKDREILKDFKDSLEHSIRYIETVLGGDLTDCDEIGYLYRDFVGEKGFGYGRYPTNQKIYEALEDINNRYEEGQDVL